MKDGLSGNIAKAFLQSKLTILLMVAFLLVGGYSTLFIPREEEPQIDVPTADIFFSYPGASPSEIEARIARPIEKVLSNVEGVEHVYSTSMPGQALLIVQFYVGEDVERSLVKLHTELMKNMDMVPPGASPPFIKTRTIDDVPVLGITLWSDRYNDFELKQLGQELTHEIKKVPDVASISIIGGRSRQVSITMDKDKMAQSHVDFLSVANQIQVNNAQLQAGNMVHGDSSFFIQTGNFLTNEEDVANLIVGTHQGLPVYLKQVARIEDGPEQPAQYVFYGNGRHHDTTKFVSQYPAVTLSIAKKKGADAMGLAQRILSKVDHIKGVLVPSEVQLTVTRNYGETASEKVSELLLHLLVAIVAVTCFVMLAMGWRGGLVVFLSVPVTFALTLFSYYLLDYTLNRITLFALVFITGIVVDDSIVIAENMHRYFKMRKLSFLDAAIFAINEVGNPTILATFTVIAAVLPMAFVTGMSGPYLSPMPIGASIAMMLSLVVALTLTPYLGYIFLREKHRDDGEHTQSLEQSRLYRIYSAFLLPMLETRWKRWAFVMGTVVILMGSMMFFYFKLVTVKMLPFDNKSEFQVVIDMPEGTTLERTYAVTQEIAQYLSKQELVKNYQGYVGTASPISFNGLMRHYDLRSGGNVADIQVNLVDKEERELQSHQIARQLRSAVQAIGLKYNANVKMVEIPPGPPVLSTIVGEIYGPDYEVQKSIGAQLKEIIGQTEGVVDLDWMQESDQYEYRFEVDRDKAMVSGVAPAQVASVINTAMSGRTVGILHDPVSFEPVNIKLQLVDAEKESVAEIKNLTVLNAMGSPISVGDLVHVDRRIKDKPIYRKNQQRVVFVLADLAGRLEGPAYALMDISKKLHEIKLPAGYELAESYNNQPDLETNYTVKWDGEWQITYAMFRDLGIAFVVVLVIIYMLIVGWFQDFKVPFVMLAAIPLSLIGIVLGHWMLNAYFTATSMIGFIALAGVMVRNSVLLIDFVNIRLRDGVQLKQAILEAGAVRMTPILLTAGAVAFGAVIILFDPIFQGLAISLMGGTVTSTILTLLVVPLLYYRMMRDKVTAART